MQKKTEYSNSLVSKSLPINRMIYYKPVGGIRLIKKYV